MAVNQGPQISRKGLVSYYDAGNGSSFKGLPTTNLMYGISYTWVNGVNETYFKVVNGTESAYIPYFNRNIDVKYVDIYNDYNSGSGQCCPSPLYFHTTGITVTGSTTYMYQIIFKTDNGYYSTNYMYRYEYGASGLITEGGLVNASRLESLGDGWFHAWGQFTTNASTTFLNCYLFHYEYLTWNRIRVAAVSLTQGTTIHRPEHILNLNYRATRGTTVATGGGLKDLIGSGTGELFNGVTIDNSYGTSLFFDGTNDYISIGSDTATNISPSTSEFTIEVLFRVSASHARSNPSAIFDRYRYGLYYNYTSNYAYFVYVNKTYDDTGNYSATTTNSATLNPKGQVNHVVFTYTKSGVNGTVSVYTNGTLTGTVSSTRISNYPLSIGYIGNSQHQGGTVYYFEGYVYFIKIYNKVLLPSEVSKNYNSLRGRMSRISNSNPLLIKPTSNSLGTNSLFSSTLLYLDPGNRQSFIPGHRFWYDLSSNKRRVTLYSNGGTTYRLAASAAPTWSSDGKGSFVFDGSNDFGRLDTEITTTTNFTVSVWVKTTASGDRGIFSHCSGGPVGMGYSVETYMKYWYYSGQWYTLTGNTIINDGTWKNLVWVTSGTNFKMYVNGVLDRETTIVAAVITLMRSVGSLWGPCSSDSYGVGQDSYGSVFSGSMGPLIVWNRALNATEVLQLYDNFKSRYTLPYIPTNGLQLYLDAGNTTSYPGSGLTWFDISGNSRNFTLDSGFTYRSSGNLFMTDGIGAVRDGVITTSTTSTIILWLKTIDTQALFIHGQDGGYYVGAYYSTAKEYHGSAGSPDFYLDSAARDNIFDFGLDGKWHMYEFRNVNLQNWTSFKFNKYSSFTFGSVNIGAIMIYNRNLSTAESQLIYNTMKTRFSNTPTVSTNGLVLHIDAGENSSYSQTGVTFSDISGLTNTATIANGAAFGTPNGGYILMDGTNDYIMANNTDISPRFSSTSVSHFIWVYPTGAGQIVTELGSTVIPPNYWVDANIEINSSGALSFSTWHGSLSNKVVSDNRTLSRWYYVGFTYDGTTLTAYINGISVGTTTFTRQAPYNYGVGLHYALFLSTTANMGTTGYAAGRFGSFKVYNRSLTTLEVLQNYKATRARFGLQHATEGLVIHLDASDRTSYQSTGTTWLDISGNNNTATLQNGPTYDVTFGGSIAFDGSNDNVYINYALLSTFSMEVWFKWTSSPASNYSRIISNSPSDNFEVGVDSSRRISYYPNGSGAWQDYIMTLTTGWNLISVTKTGTSITFYLNGSNAYTGTITNVASPAALFLSKRYTGGEPTAGNIAIFRKYNRVLTAAEVSQNYNAEKTRFGL